MEPLDTQGIARSINELLVLATLRDGAKHGYQIALDVENGSGGAFLLQHGTLYPILHRLERDGSIRGRWVEPRGERRRKQYVLTAAGRRRLGERVLEVRSIFEQVLALVGDHGESVRAGFAAG